jgi:hypothetical protein
MKGLRSLFRLYQRSIQKRKELAEFVEELTRVQILLVYIGENHGDCDIPDFKKKMELYFHPRVLRQQNILNKSNDCFENAVRLQYVFLREQTKLFLLTK